MSKLKQRADMGTCMCGVALPTIELGLVSVDPGSDVDFSGHMVLRVECPTCGHVWSRICHFCESPVLCAKDVARAMAESRGLN